LSAEEYTLLVVDDVEDNRDILARRLIRKGFSVLEAEGGRQALSLVASHPVDMVLLDIMMPGMSGVEVLEELRKTHSPAELPIIMVTAKTDSDDIVGALEAGANDYVTKPIDFPVVLARIQSHLRQKRSKKAQAAAEEAAAVARMMAGPEVRPGGLIADRYRLESRIGAGAFGAVYRAIHLELDTPVAIKVLQTGIEQDPDAIARFRREGISACRVKHPNAVAVLDFGVTAQGTAYLAMELLDGHSVYEELLRRGTLTPARAAQILIPVCDVLAVAHKSGIIHRDIKPSNVFLQRTPVGEVVKVLDFGIAKIAGDNAANRQLTVEGGILGTPAYMAPERFTNKPFDGKSDVYSVGITLFQMLEGRLPFVVKGDPMALALMHANDAPPPLQAVNPRARDAVQEIVLHALEKSPAKRPTAEEFARELRHVVDALGEHATLSAVAGAGAKSEESSIKELEIATVGSVDSALFVSGGETLEAEAPTTQDPQATQRTGDAASEGGKPPAAEDGRKTG